MDIWNNSKLVVFLAFFIPGFISIKVHDLLIASEKRDFSKDVLEVVAFSALNYAALSWLILIVEKPNFSENYPILFLIAWFFILFVMPVLWPWITLKVIRSKLLSSHLLDPIKRPWDYVFGKRETFWIIVHLKDGRRIGGLYSSDSYASSYPAEEALYLEQLWNLEEDGSFRDKVTDTRGAIVLCSEISMIEFKHAEIEKYVERKKESSTQVAAATAAVTNDY